MLDFVVAGLSANSVPYSEGLSLQRAVHQAVVSGQRPDTVILLEHDPVYTAGKRTSPDERPTDGTPVIDVDRGGKITWHGPGQLVGYPILRLSEPIDVVGYVRRLEGILIDVLAEFGIEGSRVDGRSGVWIVGDGRDEKIAALDADADRGDLVLAAGVADPDAGASVDATSVDAEHGEHVDEDALEAAHVPDDVDRLGVVQDRIPHELAGAVPCDLATAVDVDDGGSVGRPLVGGGALPGGVDRLVFEEDDGVRSLTGDHRLMDGALEGEALAVRHGVGA